jgi:XTP/dITP diphosphohydrolase
MTSPAARTIVLATSNAHKVHELHAILAARGLGIQVVGLKDLPGPFTEPEETGDTFERNATIKAKSYAKQTGLWCMADDSGLEIDALGGRPGVISSHYCTDGREAGMSREERDAANNKRVLRELEGVGFENRGARFVCVIAVASPSSNEVRLFRGTFEGRIGIPPRVPGGVNGFGYDPLFMVGPDFARTGAELSPEEKNVRSHRAAAVAKLIASGVLS